MTAGVVRSVSGLSRSADSVLGKSTVTFASYELDWSLYQLRRDGSPVAITPRAFDLLGYLLRHRDRVVTKDEILTHVWPDETVGESSLTSCINVVRQCLRDDGRRQRFIATVRGRGYRFVGAVEAPARGAAGAIGVAGTAVAEAATGVEAVTARTRRTPATLVGRGAELARVTTVLGATLAGQGHVLLLSGDPGIGKSRLAQAIAERAEETSALVVVGRARESGGAAAYWPWREAIRDLAAAFDDATLAEMMGPGAAEIAQLVRSVGERFPALATAAARDGEQARFRLFESVTALCTRAAARQPLVVLLEDLHWADRASLLLLEFLAREIATVPLLVVGTYRDVEVEPGHPLLAVQATLRREAACERVALSGLSAASVGVLAREHLGREMSAALLDAIARATEGNPLFVLEILDHLDEERGLVAVGAETLATTGGDAIDIPDGVREVIGRRVRRLSDPCRYALSLAAVIGREFAFDVLECVSSVKGEALLDLLEEAAAARVVTESLSTPGHYGFTHALIREVLYQSLSALRRTRLHQTIGGTLERLHGGDVERHLPELAHHFIEAAPAGEHAKAVDYATRAGDEAAALLAYEDAAAHYESALSALAKQSPEIHVERCRLLLALGDAEARVGRITQAHEIFGQVASLARALGDPETLAAAALGCGGRHLRLFGAVDEAAVRVLEEALARLGDGPPALRAALLARLAMALRHAPASLERRIAMTSEATLLARGVGDETVLASVLDDTIWAHWCPENLDERLAVAQELLAMARRNGDREMEIRANGWRVVSLLEQGDVATADVAIAEHGAGVAELRLRIYRWDALCLRTTRALMAGRFTDAERTANEALETKPYVHPFNGDQIYWVQLALVRIAQGRGLELEPVIQALLDRHPTSWRCGLAWIFADAGRLDDARREFERLAVDDFAALPRDSVWLLGMAHLTVVAYVLGDVGRAGVLYEHLLPFRDRLVVVTEFGLGCLGAVQRYLGLAATLLARWDDADAHFTEALATNARIGALPELALTQRDHAAMLLARGGRRDRARVRAQLQEAGTTAAQLGMERSAREIASLLTDA